MQLARAVAAKADFAGAEALYRSVIAKDKTYQYAVHGAVPLVPVPEQARGS